MKKDYKKFLFISILIISVFIIPLFVNAQEATNQPSAGSDVIGAVGNTTIPLVSFTVKYLLLIVMYIVAIFIAIAGQLVGLALGFNNTILNFDPPFITEGWNIFRDIANLVFVVGIVVIAISSILRIKGYQAQQILLKLIAAALIVNFSLLIGGAFIQPANSISCFLLKYISGESAASSCGSVSAVAKMGDSFRYVDLVNSFRDNFFSEVGGLIGVGSSASVFMIAAIVVTLVVGIVMLLTLISIAGMLFIRYFYLSFLLVVSPVVWALWVFPDTKKYFKQWWKKFIDWTIFAPLMLLFIYLALRILDTYSSYEGGIAGSQSIKPYIPLVAPFFTESRMGLFVTSLFAAAILIGGLKMAKQLGHGGTELALGAVDSGQKWAKNYVSTKTKRAGARAGRSALESKPSKVIQSGISKFAQGGKPFKDRSLLGKALTVGTFGIAPFSRKIAQEISLSSTQAQKKLEKESVGYIDDFKKRIDNMSSKQIIGHFKGFSSLEKQAAMEKLAETGKLNELSAENFGSLDEMVRVLSKAQSMGRDISKIEKRMGANIDMLSALIKGSVEIVEKDSFGLPKRDANKNIIKSTKTFYDLAPKFYEKFQKEDWKNLSSFLSKNIFATPNKNHSFLNSDQTEIFTNALLKETNDPFKKAYSTFVTGLEGANINNFQVESLRRLISEVSPDESAESPSGIVLPGVSSVKIADQALKELNNGNLEKAAEYLRQSKDGKISKMAQKIKKGIGAAMSVYRFDEGEEKAEEKSGEKEKK